MITLTVVSFNDAPHGGALQARFDELGGTIGRADTNQLVLPDPERTISRVAAQVMFRNGSYAIVDRGSNPITVNGQTLGSGREAMLKAGDKVRIGGYVIQVQEAAAAAGGKASSADPFADLLGPAAGGASKTDARLVDPLSAMQASSSIVPPTRSPIAPAPSAMPPAPPAASGIPDSWDPFAPPTNWGDKSMRKPSPAGIKRAGIGLDTGHAAPPPLIAGLTEMGSGGKSDSLDALFGLKPGGVGADPLASSKLDAPIAQPNMAGHADPMRALNSAPRATEQAVPDALSDLQRPFIPQTTINPPQLVPPPPVPAAGGTAPSGAVLSWGAGASETTSTVVNAASMRKAVRPPAMSPPSSPPSMVGDVGHAGRPIPGSPAAAAGGRNPSAAPAEPAAASHQSHQAVPRTVPQVHPRGDGGVADHALLAAFLQGLSVKDSPMTSLTPEFMRLVGTMLREAVGGTVDLLVARAAMKRELRAAATTIVARDNNPLKFSPSAEAALALLLSPPVRGFMPAEEAMRDAYSDLRAHQFAFVAGMQAALEGVLERFEPQALESQLGRASVLTSLLPGGRKAKMWDVFVDHYANIREEASEDFHTLFGKAFLKAYEEQLEALHNSTTQPGVKR